MKKILSIALALLLLTCLLPWGAVAETDPRDTLVEQWRLYLDARESLLVKLEWAYAYTQTYLDDNAWENLLRARVACSALLRELPQVQDCPALLTEEDYLTLMEAGVECQYVKDTLSVFMEEPKEAQGNLVNLQAMLLEDAFWRSGTEQMQAWLEARLTEGKHYKTDLCLTTNYLLLSLGDAKLSADFWAGMEKRWPLISAARGAWLDDPEALSAANLANYEAYASVALSEKLIGMRQYTLDMWTKAAETGDYQEVIQEALPIRGLPPLFPFPDWMDTYTAETDYLLAGETADQVARPPVGAALETLSYEAALYGAPLETTSRADLDRFVASLTDCGAACAPRDDAGEYEVSLECALEGCPLTVNWSPDRFRFVFPDGAGCFAPIWYIQAIGR